MTAFAFDTDDDNDGLPNGWERQFGAAAGERDGDPDGDGLSNLQERDAGSHPVGRFVYACAEAGTSDAFATRIDMFNPDPATAARVLVRYGTAFDPDGRQVMLIPPGAARAVDLTDGQLRFEGGEHPVIVESDLPLAVTRTFTWGTRWGMWSSHGWGSTPGACVTPAPDWHFAEGSTALSFQTFYILFNPTPDATTVRVTFLSTAPLTPIVRDVELPAGARSVLWVNAEVPEATNRDVAASFTSIDRTPFVVERSMYMKASGEALFGGGTNANGMTTPGTRWYIAEGATGGLFDTVHPARQPWRQSGNGAAHVRAPRWRRHRPHARRAGAQPHLDQRGERGRGAGRDVVRDRDRVDQRRGDRGRTCDVVEHGGERRVVAVALV